MFLTILCTLTAIGTAQSDRPGARPIAIGWHDDLQCQDDWHALDMQNQAKVCLAQPGDLKLSLGKVPADWPYAYQWSGLKKNLTADIARYPVLMAYVTRVHGYAHLDIDVLDAQGQAVKTLRSSVLNISTLDNSAGRPSRAGETREIPAGVVVADLGRDLLPATYSLQIRLIVGGDNSGCSAEYHWLRFVGRQDADRLASHPNVRLPSLPDDRVSRLKGSLRNTWTTSP